MLQALSSAPLTLNPLTIQVSTPRTFLNLSSSHIQVFEDLQPALDLAHILTSRIDTFSLPDCSAIGFALGTWLNTFHNWTERPAQGDLRRVMEKNRTSQDLKWRITYATIVDIAGRLPAIEEEDLRVLRDVVTKVRHDLELQMEDGIDGDLPNYGLIHGDFWTGK